MEDYHRLELLRTYSDADWYFPLKQRPGLLNHGRHTNSFFYVRVQAETIDLFLCKTKRVSLKGPKLSLSTSLVFLFYLAQGEERNTCMQLQQRIS